MQLAAFLCVICVICGRIHARGLKQSAQKKPQCLPQITLIYADKPKTTLTTQNCLSLRYDAACCIPLRDLRYLRENTRKSTQTIRTEETPMSPADLADLRRQTQNNNNHPNGLSLRNNAACCIPLRYLRYLRENTRKSTQSIGTKEPQCLPQISLIYADEPQNSKIPNCLSLRYNAAPLHSSA